MFELHGITKASLLAHSYGTFYVSCLLKLLPERVSTPAGPRTPFVSAEDNSVFCHSVLVRGWCCFLCQSLVQAVVCPALCLGIC
jgi:hypothetical protein